MSSSPAQFAFGPGIVGTSLNIFLLGVEVCLVFIFLAKLRFVGPWVRGLTAFIICSDISNCAFNVLWLYTNLIGHFGDTDSISKADWVFATAPALSSIVSTAVQLYFAWRMKAADGKSCWKRWAVGFIQGMAVVSGISGLATAVAIRYVPRYTDFPTFQAPLAIWLISAVICNVVITVWTTRWFRIHVYPTRMPNTAALYHRILLITANNGAIISIWATLDLFVYLFVPTGLHIAFNLPLGKFYSISFLLSQITRGEYTPPKDNEIISLEPVRPSNNRDRLRDSTVPQLPDPLPSPHGLAGEDYVLAPSQHTNESDRSSWQAASVKAAGIVEDSV